MGRKRTGILAGALTLILLLAGGCGAQTETLRYALVTGQRGAKAEKALTQLESGMEDFAGAQGLKARTFASEKETVASYGDEISQAVQEGASVILANGEAMGKAVYTAQNEHRKTKFLLFGAEPSSEDGTKTKIRKNTLSILFSPEQEGYLAGYAAVKEGWQRIGFLAGPRTQDAERYYRGLVQGAEYAAGMLGLEEESVEIRFEFAGTGKLTPVRTEEALLWYEEGTEAILPYGDMTAVISYSKIHDSVNPSVISGEGGSIIIDKLSSPKKIVFIGRDGKEEVLFTSEKDNNMRYEIRAFVEAIRKGEADSKFGDDTAITISLIDEIRRQNGIRFPADVK